MQLEAHPANCATLARDNFCHNFVPQFILGHIQIIIHLQTQPKLSG